jgi:23S rRNA (uracil1939-C5)-methyltransferase
MEFSFATRWLTEPEVAAPDDAGSRFGLGLHVRGRFDRVVDVACHLHPAEGREILGLVRELSAAGGLPAYSTKTHEGFWRHVVLREGVHTGERMVVLITAVVPPGAPGWREVDRVAAALMARGPRITSLIHGMNDRKAALAVSDRMRVLAGEPVIRERLLDLTFEIGPSTFFQTNTEGAEVLFREAVERGGFRAEDTVWDLYCGAGAIALCVARGVRRVVGVEVVPEAVEAARRNAAGNAMGNAEFLCGDVKTLLREGALAGRPDAVVLDPPRDGVHADVLAAVVRAAPARIVYVSCNPATLARDLGILAASGYVPGPVRPVDLFPHTGHIECVVRLDRGARPNG